MTKLLTKDATPLEVLKAMRQLLAKPESWTTKAWARDQHGEVVNIRDPKARCFCLSGALTRVTRIGALVARTRVRGLVDKGTGGLVGFNDAKGRTHAEILDFLDGHIEQLENAQ